MNPLEQQVQALEKRLAALERVENVAFIESMTRRLRDSFDIPERLDDLIDVDVPSPSDGQVLKYTTTGVDRWIAGTDNTA